MLKKVIHSANILLRHQDSYQGRNYYRLVKEVTRNNTSAIKLPVQLQGFTPRFVSPETILKGVNKHLFRPFEAYDSFMISRTGKTLKWTTLALITAGISNFCHERYQLLKETAEKVESGDKELYGQVTPLARAGVTGFVFKDPTIRRNINIALTRDVLAQKNIQFMTAKNIGTVLSYKTMKENSAILMKRDALKRGVLYTEWIDSMLKIQIIGLVQSEFFYILIKDLLFNFLKSESGRDILKRVIIRYTQSEAMFDIVNDSALVNNLYPILEDKKISRSLISYLVKLLE